MPSAFSLSKACHWLSQPRCEGRAGAAAGSVGCGNLAPIPGEHAPGVTGLGGPDF